MQSKQKIILIGIAVLIIAVCIIYFILTLGNQCFILVSNDIENLPENTPLIYADDFKVGEVVETILKHKSVEYSVMIYKKYKNIVNESSKFYFRRKKENGKIVKFIKIKTSEQNAKPLVNGSRIKMESKSILDIFR